MGKRKRMAICEFCKNLIAAGEGDFLCCECGEPVAQGHVSIDSALMFSENKHQPIHLTRNVILEVLI